MEKIPKNDVLEVTVLLLACSYRGNEFIRVGYYVYNQYDNDEMQMNPPDVPDLSRVRKFATKTLVSSLIETADKEAHPC